MGLAHVIPEQLRNAWEAVSGGCINVYSVNHYRSFCYIDDAVEMLKRMLEIDECAGQTLNLGTQSPEVSIREVAQTCIDVTGKLLTIKAFPATEGSPERRAPDMNRTRELTGYESQVSLATGISQTWSWYRDHIFEGRELTAR